MWSWRSDKKKLPEEGKRYIWWYAFCFALFGLIDQRRGSAEGPVQMFFANLTGMVIGLMLLPSLKKSFVRSRFFRVWAVVCVPGIVLGCMAGYLVKQQFPIYLEQWCTGALNVALIGCLMLYIIWDWKEIKQKSRLDKGCFFSVGLLLVLMQLSVHEVLWPLWFLMLFGCFYLIGIPKEKEEDFLWGMAWGLIAWFFIQQIIAFGFRPYDYARYRGLYSGETQNGIFYMICFCAFTAAWLLLKRSRAKKLPRFLCFVLSAGCVGFQLLTGGRASFLGIIAAAVLSYMAYDIIMCKSFRHWILHGVALGGCMLVLFPVVYGCVRYLPVILHHPVWFEGEYNADTSVHSYDPWNSERYVTFERVLEENVGRLLQIFGIQLVVEEGEARLNTPLSLTVCAAGEPGSSPDNPFVFEETDFTSSISIRRTIYYYYLTHLNLAGHSKHVPGFYMADGLYYDHAHNMFLQIAYDYGVLAGILFLIWNICCLIRLIRRKDMTGILFASFFVAILAYGCAEMAVTTGQITMVLLFVAYYFGMQKSGSV